jgi:hypothetical protein
MFHIPSILSIELDTHVTEMCYIDIFTSRICWTKLILLLSLIVDTLPL